jgi:hypothetical protein
VENFARARSIDPRCYSELPLVVAASATAEQSTPAHSSLGPTLLLAIAVLGVLLGTTLFVLIRMRVSPPGPS